jgi:hypothetical protein
MQLISKRPAGFFDARVEKEQQDLSGIIAAMFSTR